MKRFICILTLCSALFCYSCVKPSTGAPVFSEAEVALDDADNSEVEDTDNHIYTISELWELFGVIIDFNYAGWCDVYNDTDKPVKMTICYPYPRQGSQDVLEALINPGDYSRLMIGECAPSWDFNACTKATFLQEGGTPIVISPEMNDEWSHYFLTNVEARDDYEICDFEGKNLRHDVVTVKYHFNDTVIDIWDSYNAD